MPKRGERQSDRHPWRRRSDRQIREHEAKKRGLKIAREPADRVFVCVSCGNPDCIAGECVSS